jgi:hypothetical protein
MIVDSGLVPLDFYLYGSKDSGEMGEHQDSNATQSVTGTRQNAIQSLKETTSTVTPSLAATTINVTQSLASTSSKMAKDNNKKVEEDQDVLDDDNRKPAAVVFATAGHVTHPLVATTGNDTQSLAVTIGTATNALAGNATQSLAGTGSNVAHSASNVAHSTVAATGSVAHSTTFTEANTGAELASFSPEMIAEDAAVRELLLEMHPLTPQVNETLLAIFHPIICLQLLTVLPFIHRWLQMILPLGKC